MRKLVFPILLVATALLLWSNHAGHPAITQSKGVPQELLENFRKNLNQLHMEIHEMVLLTDKIDRSSMIERFKQARLQYKRVEWLVDYAYRESAVKLNGANLPEASPAEPELVLYPSGFQVLEEVILEEVYNKRAVRQVLEDMDHTLQNLTRKDPLFLSEGQCFQAIQINLFRLMTKGITGFDSPVLQHSIPEAVETLESIKLQLQYFDGVEDISSKVQPAIDFLHGAEDFNTFDRYTFIRKHLNSIVKALGKYQQVENYSTQYLVPTPWNTSTTSFFYASSWDWTFFAPSDAVSLDVKYVRLGEKLFKDKRLSSDQNRACITCHQPDKAFTDGKVKNLSLGRENLLRNTPTLLYSAWQNNQFADSKVVFLEDQIHAVIVNRDEMNGEMKEILAVLSNDKSLRNDFKAAFGDKRITERRMKLVLAAYLRSLGSFNSPFDQAMRGEGTLNQEQIAGFNLFMGKAKCATCHFIPTFNGSAPPFYEKMESEVLGVPDRADQSTAQLDSDVGKFTKHQIPHHRFAFKTVTLRNVSKTAPYMHNGVFATLEEVIDFYNDGGGAGYGFELENQTLPSDSLQLTNREKNQLIDFLKTLDD